MDILKLSLIILVIVGFIVAMMKKKVPTIIALPLIGLFVAVIAAFGSEPLAGLLPYEIMVEGEAAMAPGIFGFVLIDGSKMMAGAIVTVIFASAFSRIMMKQKIIERIIKTAAEYAGDKPFVIAIVFYVIVSVMFMAIGGLGGVILVGSIILPIMLSAGIKPLVSAVIFLFGFSSGLIMNPMNYSIYIPLLAPQFGGDLAQAQAAIIKSGWPIFVITFLVPFIYIFKNVDRKVSVSHWAQQSNIDHGSEASKISMLAPIIPVVIILVAQFTKLAIPTEVAIIIGILFVLLTTKSNNKMQLVSQGLLEGTQDVAGVILLMMGLGILIKGVQYPAVQTIVGPSIEMVAGYLKNPVTYVIGFTIGSVLALYRGPMNSYGIGGALPSLFGAAGFSPVAIIWALRADGNMQAFGDPTNSHNIWIADFVNVDVNDILKEVFIYGILQAFLILTYAVLIAKIPLIV
ncbi:transporter [Erysipelothrix urinaevulpis]|uniref:transporter n=1 Tax=Erysipelothrix urinaevulpis TaxID=2683717 RepID=UPI00135A077B|nr:transporter [Erysipelothrix urinaevulpis]